MKKVKAWVWFKGGLADGSWESGFSASSCDEEGILIEKPDFVSCRVPEWRISLTEPEDLKVSPIIPKAALWKYLSK